MFKRHEFITYYRPVYYEVRCYMKHVNMKMVLGLAVSMLFLIGLAAPVSALQTNIKIETNNQGFASGANNHTYVYVEPDPLNLVSRSTMHLNEDLDFFANRYDATGWAQGSGGFTDGSNAPFNWMSFNNWGTGHFENPNRLPGFYDFEASDGSDHAVNTTLETRTFGLTFGQHTPVIADAGYAYYGTLGISNQEFVHLTVDCRQDDVSWFVTVIDPEGRFITDYAGSEGDIWTIPFKPSTSGTYYVILQVFPSVGTFALFDFLPVAVAPQAIAAGNIVTGELPTGELISRDDTGSWVHAELAPTVHTYKVNSPSDVASLTYAFNYPEVAFVMTQFARVIFTSAEWMHDYNGGSRYEEEVMSPQVGEYFFRGGPYYVTVVGGDNIAYTLYHQANSHGAIPLNHEFQFENYIGATVSRGYTLDIAEPSILRVNSTASGGELSIYMVGAYEEDYRVSRGITDDTTLEAAFEYYLPVGEYIVVMSITNNVNEWVEFHVGPIVDQTSIGFNDVGGFFVDTDFFQLYNMTLILTNPDNITVGVEVSIYDASGNILYLSGTNLANRWDGSQIVPHPSIWNNDTFNYAGQQWYDEPSFVGICTYSVANNTQGATNFYSDYTVNLTIQWQNRMDDYFVNILNLDVTNTALINYTLPLPGDSNEFHGLVLNTTPGTWYNVSVMTGDVSGFSAEYFSAYDGRTHMVDWADLNDYLVGSASDLSFQFGAISELSFLELQLTRDQIADGFLFVKITPMTTHPLVVEEITPLGPDILGILGGIALPAAIGVGVIVVVYIVYVKKVKT